jgi:hypothetical protein
MQKRPSPGVSRLPVSLGLLSSTLFKLLTESFPGLASRWKSESKSRVVLVRPKFFGLTDFPRKIRMAGDFSGTWLATGLGDFSRLIARKSENDCFRVGAFASTATLSFFFLDGLTGAGSFGDFSRLVEGWFRDFDELVGFSLFKVKTGSLEVDWRLFVELVLVEGTLG